MPPTLETASIKLNGTIHIISTILKIVAASAAEAELGALFVNAKEGCVIRLILHELGHPQPPTPIHFDNSTAAGIANNTVKRQRSQSMEMRYFLVADQVQHNQFDVKWHPGQENLGDYYTKRQTSLSKSCYLYGSKQARQYCFLSQNVRAGTNG